MTDQHKTKKRRVLALRNRTSKLTLSTQSNNNLSELGKGQSPSTARAAYPTDIVRVPRIDGSKPRLNRALSPDLGVASTAQSDSQTIIISSDSDDAQLIKSPKRKRKYSAIRVDSGDENDSSEDGLNAKMVGKGKGKVQLEYNSESDEVGSDKNDEDFDADTEDSDVEGDILKTSSTLALSQPKTLRAGSSTKSSGRAQVEVGIRAPETAHKGGKVAQVDDNKVLKGHVKMCVLNACNLEHAQDAGTLVPQFDEARRPVHFVDGVFIPHLDRSFDLEWKDWRSSLLKIVRDRSQLDPQCPDWVLSAGEKDIRTAMKNGAHATMKTAWKKHQTGDGKAWLTGKRNSTRQWGRRKQKAANRMTALIASGLDVNSFKFIANPNFVSDEEDDPEVEGCRIVKVPEYRTDDVTELAGSLDVAFNANKHRPGNLKCETYKYVKINIQVPKLKGDDPKRKTDKAELRNEVPKWAISAVWEAANPELELGSRCHIDPDKTEMPELDKFRKFVHRYKPKERSYQSTSLVSTPTPAETSAPIVSNSELVVSMPAPAVSELRPIVSEPGPIVSGDIGEASAHIVTPMVGDFSNSPYEQPPGPSSVHVSVKSAPETSESHAPALLPSAIQTPNPNFGAQPAIAYGDQQPPYVPSVAGEAVLIHTIDGQAMWVWPCLPPPAQDVQSNGRGAMPMDILNDPNLDESTRSYPPNVVPPPPLPPKLTEPSNKLPDAQEIPTELKRKRASRARNGRERRESGEKSAKSKGAKLRGGH